MNKSLIVKYILCFGAGSIAASTILMRQPDVVGKIVEVRSSKDIKTIEELKKELSSEKYTNYLFRLDTERASKNSSNTQNDIEETITIIKPDGTKIITEKKDKSKIVSEASSEESTKEEKKVIEVVKNNEVVETKKETSIKEEESSSSKEFTFNSSLSLGLGVAYNFDEKAVKYNFLTAYRFSPLFGIYSSINLSAPTFNNVESVVFGFSINL